MRTAILNQTVFVISFVHGIDSCREILFSLVLNHQFLAESTDARLIKYITPKIDLASVHFTSYISLYIHHKYFAVNIIH